MESFVVDYALPAAYVLFFLCAAGAFLGPIITALGNPKSIFKSLIGIVVLAVIFFIGYSLAGAEVTEKYKEFGVDTPGASQTIGGLLTVMYILIGVAILGIVASWITKLIS